jgi:aminopeptidase N
MAVRVKVPGVPNRFGRDAGIVYLGNALPLLAVTDSSGPALEPYTDLGDPFYSLSARWSVRLDVPSGLTAATTGATKSRRRLAHGFKRLQIAAAHARDFAIVLGRFSVQTTRTATGVTLRRYSRRGSDASAAAATLGVARAAVEAYTAWYGPLGVSEVDLLPGPSSLGSFGTGMEFPGLVLTPDGAQTAAHEIAHQWWYSLVGNDQWRSPWLDEAFSEYASRRLPAEVVGPDELRCDYSDPVASYGGSGPLTASMNHWDAEGGDEYYRSIYMGGACALRLLERELGPDAMTAFLHSFADAHRFGVVDTDDFVSALRAAAPPGYDVDSFLRRARILAP